MNQIQMLMAAVAALAAAIGVLYRDVRRLLEAEKECQRKLARIEVEVKAHRHSALSMHRENTQRLDRIQKAVSDTEEQPPCPTDP